MKIHWNKVTWYSKTLAVILFVATFALAFCLGRQYEAVHHMKNMKEMSDKNMPVDVGGKKVPKIVTFDCIEGKAIDVQFQGDMVFLELSDGRSNALDQVISASGARYANSDESFIFWNKGKTAFVEEKGVVTYKDCVINDSF